MIKITKLSNFLMLLGGVTLIASVIHWAIQFTDFSQLLFGVGGSFIIFFLAYFHSWMRQKDEGIKDLNQGMDALKKWEDNEIEKINKRIGRV